MRIISGVAGLALLGMSGAALADEPVRLDGKALDQVTAGLYDTFALSFVGPTLATGGATTTSNLAATQTIEVISIVPPNFAADARSFALVQSSVQSSNVGTSSASNSGGVYTGVFPSAN